MSEIFDCRRCGACCTTLDARPGYVDLTPFDLRRLPPGYARFVRRSASGTRLATRIVLGRARCVSLSGRLGRTVRCEIYPQRPAGCRRLRPGSRACTILRELILGRDGADETLPS